MPRRVGERSHRFMSVVLLLGVLLPMAVLLRHRHLDLLVLLQDMDLELAVGKARGLLFSLEEISDSPRALLQTRRPRLERFRPRERCHHALDVVDVLDDVP